MSPPLAAQPKLRLVTDELAATPSRRAVIVPVRGMDSYNSHPATGLTADMLVSFLREAEAGRPLRLFDAFENMVGVDGHARGLLEGRYESVAGSNWVLRPGRDDKPSTVAAQALEEYLRHATRSTTPALYSKSAAPTGGFREFVEWHQRAPHFGIACTNIVWDIEAGFVVPSHLINAAQRRFAAPSQERADEVWLINALSNGLVELEAGLWAVSRALNRNPWASGSLCTAAWWMMFKRWGVRDLQMFAEMFGLPLAIGYYEEGAGPESRAALEQAVQMIGEDGWAVLSALTELVIKETARSGDASTVYPVITKMANEELSKLLAGGTLNTDVAGVGSYNAASVHESREYKKIRADARRTEDMFTRDIGTPFVVWNGFDRAAPPTLQIRIARDSLERAQVIEKIGAAIPVDPSQLRDDFELREPPEGKGVMFPSKAAAAPGASPPGGPGGR